MLFYLNSLQCTMNWGILEILIFSHQMAYPLQPHFSYYFEHSGVRDHDTTWIPNPMVKRPIQSSAWLPWTAHLGRWEGNGTHPPRINDTGFGSWQAVVWSDSQSIAEPIPKEKGDFFNVFQLRLRPYLFLKEWLPFNLLSAACSRAYRGRNLPTRVNVIRVSG